MASGFAIEYVVHIAHAFLASKDGDCGAQRMAKTLEDMGFTVFTAFLSTAVQQLVLLFFAHSYAFAKFCLVMEVIVVVSGFAGFLVVPTLLALFIDLELMISRCCR